VLLYPVRRRVPPRRQQLDFTSGDSLRAARDGDLLSMLGEVWVDRRYLPGEWRRAETPTVVDIGANVGVFAVWTARELGATRIVAIEPDPGSATLLRANLSRNRVDGATVVEAALGDDHRVATLYRRGPAAMNTLFARDIYGSRFEPTAKVSVLTLDDVFERFAIDRCDLLKLDCEGAEYEILYGASMESLARVHHVAAEWHVGLNDHDPDRLQDFLERRGFAVKRFPPLDEEGGHLHASRRP
jgi:FkbM family methyltransferase